MEREIKFRGKRKSDGLWLQGSLINNLFGHPIFGQMEHVITDINEYEYDCYQDLDNCDIEVLPETVGQFIGLYDKNGNEIYQGDVCNAQGCLYEVVFKGIGFWFKDFDDCLFVLDIDKHNVTVVSNIHDNPLI